MANQKQLEDFLAGNPRATLTFTEKKNNKVEYFRRYF